jgi:hypothetical protein
MGVGKVPQTESAATAECRSLPRLANLQPLRRRIAPSFRDIQTDGCILEVLEIRVAQKSQGKIGCDGRRKRCADFGLLLLRSALILNIPSHLQALATTRRTEF